MELIELNEKVIYGLENKGIFKKLGCDYYRVISSSINYSIDIDNSFIGIVNLNSESTNDFLFLDIYILNEEQNKGYGKIVTLNIIEKFKNNNEILIAQTRNNNIPANKILKSFSKLFIEYKDNNYYLLSNKNKITKEKIEKLVNHIIYINSKTIDFDILNKEKEYILIRNNYK